MPPISFRHTPHSILVTGGSGYVGSVLVQELIRWGYDVVVIDRVVPMLPFDKRVQFFPMDYGDTHQLQALLSRLEIRTVVHLAASIEVAESVVQPEKYYENNVTQFLNFLNTVRTAGITQLVAASSSAVYGTPHAARMTEEDPCAPLSPYGRTKLMLEWILHDYAVAYGIRSVILRYANIAGAVPEENLGEQHTPETHLIPRALAALTTGQPLSLYGTDYPTPDGTCLRDFVHVRDVAAANIRAVEYLQDMQPHTLPLLCNVGSGRATSVRELITAIEQSVGEPVPVLYGARRAGDPATIVLNIERIQSALSWRPQHSCIHKIVDDASLFYFKQNKNDFTQRIFSSKFAMK